MGNLTHSDGTMTLYAKDMAGLRKLDRIFPILMESSPAIIPYDDQNAYRQAVYTVEDLNQTFLKAIKENGFDFDYGYPNFVYGEGEGAQGFLSTIENLGKMIVDGDSDRRVVPMLERMEFAIGFSMTEDEIIDGFAARYTVLLYHKADLPITKLETVTNIEEISNACARR